jgi:hypothetical protein
MVGSDARNVMNNGYKDSFSRASNFHCYAVLFQAFKDHMLPPPEAKGS